MIVEEINYWKTHKLLPETYCDYLLALYTQGENSSRNETTIIQNIITTMQILLCMILLPFSFLVIYFTKFEPILQLVILILFITYAFWTYWYLTKRKHRFGPLTLIIALFIVLLLSIFLTNLLVNNSVVTFLIIIVNFVIWFYTGRKGNVLYLKYSSIIGIIFTIFYTIF